MILRGRHFLKSWSSTQKSISLSSAEAELIAAVKMSTELIGITQMAADWGEVQRGRLFVDSSAAIGIMSRQGNGKMRHVKVGSLWIQAAIEDGEIDLHKVKGEDNPADLLTKNVGQAKKDTFLELCGQQARRGKADKALELASSLGHI